MKVCHPENNSGDCTGHGLVHIFISRGGPAVAGPRGDRVGQEIMGKEVRGRGGRRKTEKK